MGLKDRLENFRRWIDGDAKETVSPERRSSADDFFIALAREVEADMRREIFTPPSGPTYLPREYIVFLSSEDDAKWRGPKREGLERALRQLLSERAKDLAGSAEFTLKLRVDGTLERGRFRAQPVWDQREETVLARQRRDEEETLTRCFAISARRIGEEAAPPRPRSFFTNEITIGRASAQTKVDLALEGDPEISRKHATLVKCDDGGFTSILEIIPPLPPESWPLLCHALH
jgi:hypothetical protein